MSPTLNAFLRSWPWDPWLLITLALALACYMRGWLVLRQRDPTRWPGSRPVAFAGGLVAIFLALASPVEPFASLLLQIHMVQHLLLMMVAPPLVWLGAPLFPLLRGLPRPVRAYWVVPLLRSSVARTLFTWLTQPLVAWLLYVSVTWLWHVPVAYEWALRNSDWHVVEHSCFIAVALLFWYPVVRPFPSRPRWSLWLLFPYLILADVQNTVLAAWLTFSSRVLYPYYAQVPRVGGISAIDDQAAAGVIMWVPGSIAFLLPLFVIGIRLLSGSQAHSRGQATRVPTRPREFQPVLLTVLDSRRSAQAVRPATQPWDLLRTPYLGTFMRWRGFRPTLQALSAIVAVLLIVDGLCGPQVSPLNLAGVLPWIHWRGAVVFGLLVAGNWFCLACPFTLPRKLARRWLPRGRSWPKALRNKWPAVGLLALFLWSYEAFALWDNPWLTAWIAVGYFVAAFIIDSCFRDGSFCKYVCPIGQFNFVNSLVSPLEVKVREPAVCAACRTQDCIRGNETARGCELDLFQPRKQGNLDCTFCLDCVHACPHENVGVLAVAPGKTLWSDPFRSGLGRLSRRPDLAALVLVLVFGAFANAAGMVGPVVAWQNRLADTLGDSSHLVTTTIYYAATIAWLPLFAVGCAAAWSRRLGAPGPRLVTIASRYALALVPLGFGMWVAHYGFHLLTSYATLIPVTQRIVADLGWRSWGEPLWKCSCCQPTAAWIPEFEIFSLNCGLLLSLYTGLRIAESQGARALAAVKVFAPWALLSVALYLAGIWIVGQPMQMRGTLPAPGSLAGQAPG